MRYAEALSVDGRVRAWVVGTLDPRWLDALAREVSRDRFQRDDCVIVTDDEMRLLVRGPGPVGASVAGATCSRT